jgi:hypothetical protein
MLYLVGGAFETCATERNFICYTMIQRFAFSKYEPNKVFAYEYIFVYHE